MVETPGPALFGRDWLSKIQLNWGEIKALKLSKTPEGVMQRKVDQLLQQYESVFFESVDDVPNGVVPGQTMRRAVYFFGLQAALICVRLYPI